MDSNNNICQKCNSTLAAYVSLAGCKGGLGLENLELMHMPHSYKFPVSKYTILEKRLCSNWTLVLVTVLIIIVIFIEDIKNKERITMSWSTIALGASLVIAICSVHNSGKWQSSEPGLCVLAQYVIEFHFKYFRNEIRKRQFYADWHGENDGDCN